MADKAHITIWQKGTSVWNEWRKANPKIRPDLSRLNISGKDLQEGDYSNTDLSDGILRNSNLCKADLTGANLTGVDLSYADLSEANLRRAIFAGANLEQVDFTRADLGQANLSKAYLRETDFSEAYLGRATLIGAHILAAHFTEAHLNDADFSECTITAVWFNRVDLSLCKGLETITHSGPSTVDLDTIYRSGGNIPEIFLRGAGVSEDLISQAKSLVATISPIQFYSCFISYSHADKAFARKLYDSLETHGIDCWLDEHHLLPGDDIYHEVDRGIRRWDKMLLCCSESSLKSWWVDNEIGTAFEKEQQLMKDREGTKVQVLVPLNLDGYLFSDKWKSGYKAQVKRRLAADFTESDTGTKFDEQVERLIKALRADEGAREKPPKPRL